jgi:hypothetical protein
VLESYDVTSLQPAWSLSTTEVPLVTTDDGTTLLLRAGNGDVVRRAAETGAPEMALRPVMPARTDASAALLVGARKNHVVVVAVGVPNASQLMVTDWSTATRDLVAAACGQASRNLTPQEWTEFVGNRDAYKATCDAKFPPT